MKLLMRIGLLFSLSFAIAEAKGDRVLVDKIVVRVNGANILYSDLEKPQISMNGNKASLEDLISQELVVQHAISMHMTPSDEDINRQIVAFKMNNNIGDMSDADFEAELKKMGWTLMEYKVQMGYLLAVDRVKHAEISEKSIVSTQEIEAYFKKHPEYVNEAYNILICDVPTSEIDNASYGNSKAAVWEDLGWVEPKDLNDTLKVITNHQVGDVVGPIKTEHGYQLIKLVEKRERREKLLAEAYRGIERKLQRQRRDKIMKKFEKELRNKASIIYFS